MKSKARLIFIIVDVLLLVAFNLILFLVTSEIEKTPIFWSCFAFLNLAAVCTLGSTLLTTLKDKDSFLFALPIVYASAIYLCVEAILGFAFAFQNNGLLTWAIVLQAVALILYIIVILLTYLGILFVKKDRDYVEKKVGYIAGLKDRVAALADAVTFPEAKKDLEKLAADIRFSDPMSHEQLAPLEEELMHLIEDMEVEPENEELLKAKTKEASLLLRRRNARAKSLK